MSTTPKQTPPDPPRVTLTPFGDDGAIAVYPWKVYRVLLDDGRTLDVTAIRDDSDLRGEILKFTQAKKIEGMALIGLVEEPKPEPKAEPVKRAVKRTVKKAS